MAGATLGAHNVTSATFMQGRMGAWSADVKTDDVIPDAELDGPLTLTLGPLVLAAASVRGVAFTGSTSVRLVGGAGGWRRNVPGKAYALPQGVRLSLVASDLARAVGEMVALDMPDEVLSTAWVRFAGHAGEELTRLGRPWYVRDDGVTVLGERAPLPVVSPFDLVSFDAARGIVTIATEALGEWRPGATFTSPRLSGTFRVGGVVLRIEAAKIRAEVWTDRGGAP